MSRPGRALRFSEAARRRVVDLSKRLPPEAGADVRQAVMRLRKPRSARQAVAAFEDEIVHLFEVVAPTLVDHPLPIRTPARARTIVAAVAGSAAAIEEIEAIALLLPGVEGFAAPTLPVIIASSFAALTLEAYVAASLRVHLLRAKGNAVDPHEITRDAMRAMTGRGDVQVTKATAQVLSRRMLRRWSRGVVPFVGIGYASWDAQRTINEIARMSR